MVQFNIPTMPDYYRTCYPGETSFFTEFLLQRHGNDLLMRHIETLIGYEG